jgi:hypothetical protein
MLSSNRPGSCRDFSRAGFTDIPRLWARVVGTMHGGRSQVSGRPQCLRRVERRERTADDHPHDDSGPTVTALRPPASGSRPTHGGRDHRHRSRSPSLNGAWVARQGAKGRGWPRRDGPEGAGTPARSPEAPPTREETHCTTATRAGPASKLGVLVDARAPAQRRRQDQDPARCGSGPRVCSAADAPAVPPIVTESVLFLATTSARVCA